MPLITGTSGNDVINGTTGDDDIQGLGGDDTIDGGDGNDVLHGGLGNDILTDTSGLNQLFGDGGDDQLIVDIYDAAGRIYLDGGSGNDIIRVGFPSGGLALDWGVDIVAGDGDDTVLLSQGDGNIVDLGTGNDQLVWIGNGTTTITLGEGADEISLGLIYTREYDFYGQLILTDYEPGVNSLSIAPAVGTVVGWNGYDNPFAAGFFRLVQDGADAVLQRDQDGPGGVVPGRKSSASKTPACRL